MLRLGLLMFALLVSTCSSSHAQTRMINEKEKSLIASSYGRILKDPSSAQYEWAPIPINDRANTDSGYCFRVNAKNSYGGYAGYKLIVGKIIRVRGVIQSFSYVTGNQDSSPALIQTTAELCRAFGYDF